MAVKYFNGIVPDYLDLELQSAAEIALESVNKNMDTYHIDSAAEAIFNLFHRANKYIDENSPWLLAKNDADRPKLGTVIYNLLETIRFGAVLLEPFIPGTSSEILNQLGTNNKSFDFGSLVPGEKLGEAKILFARIDEEKFLLEINKNKAPEIPEPEHEPEIEINNFSACELRVAKIIACELIPKAKKLLKLELDLGYEKRTVVSGIAECYSPEELLNKKVICIVNLKPAILRGVESRGMILASSGQDDKISVIFTDGNIGDRVR